jgi:hypothetical protein
LFCPVCKYEYKSGIKVCPDCGEKLVEKLSLDENDKKFDNIKFVPLPNLPGRVYADMIKETLDAKDIPCYIRSEGVGDAYQFPGTTPLGVIRLYVPEDKLKECIEIQQQMLDHI